MSESEQLCQCSACAAILSSGVGDCRLSLFQEARHQYAFKQVVLRGLQERWGAHWDPSLNPDLDNITVAYPSAHVYVLAKDNCVIGTGILNSHGELVRMHVAKEWRRHGFGSLLLHQLLAAARLDGRFTRVTLETTSSWTDAISFYEQHGFQKTHEKDGDVYFELRLSNDF